MQQIGFSLILWTLLILNATTFDFHSYQFILWKGSSTAQTPQEMLTVPAALPAAHDSSYSREVVMAGLKLSMKNVMMIQVSLQPYSSDSTINIDVYTSNTYLYELSVYVVLVQSSSNWVRLASGTTNTGAAFYVTISPALNSSITYQARPFLRSIHYSSTSGQTPILHSDWASVSSNTQVKVNLHSHNGYTTLHNVTFVVLLYAPSLFNNQQVVSHRDIKSKNQGSRLLSGDNLGLPNEVAGVAATTYDGRCLLGFRYMELGGNSSGYYYRSVIFDARHNPFQSVENIVAVTSSGAAQHFTTQWSIVCLWGCPSTSLFNSGSGTCILCSSYMTNCTTCTASNLCTSCIANYVVSGSGASCVTCASATLSCATCLNTSYCISCVSNAYYLSSNNLCLGCATAMVQCSLCLNQSHCIACADNSYGLNSSHQCMRCSVAIPFCKLCANASICTQCQPYYTTNSNDTCSKCNQLIPNCMVCSNYSFCSVCLSASFTPVNTSSACQACSTVISNCETCLNVTYCTFCLPTYILGTSLANSSSQGCICPSDAYQNGSQLCQACSSVMANCHSCNNASYCLQCVSSQYGFDSNSSSCLPCQAMYPYCQQCDNIQCTGCPPTMKLASDQLSCQCILGHIASGLCTTNPGCTAAINQQGQVICTACDTNSYHPRPINSACQCLQGTLINQQCISQVGCVSQLTRPNGNHQCTACNVSLGFLPTPDSHHQCTCITGYSIQDTRCLEVCGDGLLFSQLSTSCDDGNLEDHDGCSSTCQIQFGYRCKGGTPSSSSSCVYHGIPVTVSLTSIRKSEGLNQGVFIFAFSPPLSAIRRMSILDWFGLECQDTSYSIESMIYQEGQLTVTADYTSNMEGHNCELLLTFDHTIVNSSNTSLAFQANSQTLPLVFSNKQQQYTRLKLIFRILSYIVIALFLVSLVGHKMIGAELMSCSHVVYLSYSLYETPSYLISSLKQFKLVTGYWSLFHSLEDSQLLAPFTSRIELSPDFLESSLLVVAPIIIFGIIFLIGLVQGRPRIEDDRYIPAWSLRMWQRGTKVIYNYCWFPLLAGFCVVLNIAFYISNLRLASTSTTAGVAAQFISLLALGSVTAIQSLQTNARHHKSLAEIRGFRGIKPWYIPLFLLRNILTSIFFEVGISVSLSIATLPILLLQCIYLIWILWYGPYKHTRNILSLALLEATTIYSICIPLLSRFMIMDQNLEFMVLMILEALICLSLLASCLRIIEAYRELIRQALNSISLSTKEDSVENKVDKEQEEIQQHLRNNQLYRADEDELHPYHIFRRQHNYDHQSRSRRSNREVSSKTDRQLQNNSQIHLIKKKLREDLLNKRKIQQINLKQREACRGDI